MTQSETTKWVRLGDYIEVYDRKNTEGKPYPFFGINKDKTFMPTVADTNELDNTKYKVVEKGVFVFSGMQTGRDVCIRIAVYDKDNPVLVSPAYTTFKVKDPKEIIPDYLFLHFNRSESDRYGWFLSDGSIRSNLDWDRFCDIEIPLPSPEVQQELVDTYNGIKAIAEQNEALNKDLLTLCEAEIVNLYNKYPSVPIGNYIDFIRELNSDCSITLEQGINIAKEFITPHRGNSDLSKRVIVRHGQIAYCSQLNNENVAVAYREGDDCVVSSVYRVIDIKPGKINEIDKHYLFLHLCRKEFGRFVYWASIGSAYEFLREQNLCEWEIPLPPIEVQKSIVELFNCADRAKKIASEARERLKILCPALVQRAANS